LNQLLLKYSFAGFKPESRPAHAFWYNITGLSKQKSILCNNSPGNAFVGGGINIGIGIERVGQRPT